MSWTMIESQTLGSSAASVTLGSGGTIPQTYKTLKLVVSVRSDRSSTNDNLVMQLNNNASSYTARYVAGDGAAASSGTASTIIGDVDAANNTASTFASYEVTIPNYAGSTNKPYSTDTVTEQNGTTAYQSFRASLWSNTAAVTSIVLTLGTGPNFVTGSSFTLYGLK